MEIDERNLAVLNHCAVVEALDWQKHVAVVIRQGINAPSSPEKATKGKQSHKVRLYGLRQNFSA